MTRTHYAYRAKPWFIRDGRFFGQIVHGITGGKVTTLIDLNAPEMIMVNPTEEGSIFARLARNADPVEIEIRKEDQIKAYDLVARDWKIEGKYLVGRLAGADEDAFYTETKVELIPQWSGSMTARSDWGWMRARTADNREIRLYKTEPLTVEAVPGVQRVVIAKPNGFSDGPDQIIRDMNGNHYFHPGRKRVYRVGYSIYDAERERWLVSYSEVELDPFKADAGRVPQVYAHLPEDFLRPGRFIQIA